MIDLVASFRVSRVSLLKLDCCSNLNAWYWHLHAYGLKEVGFRLDPCSLVGVLWHEFIAGACIQLEMTTVVLCYFLVTLSKFFGTCLFLGVNAIRFSWVPLVHVGVLWQCVFMSLISNRLGIMAFWKYVDKRAWF